MRKGTVKRKRRRKIGVGIMCKIKLGNKLNKNVRIR